MSDATYFVYIATNKHNTVLYIGVTNNVERRAFEHKEKVVSSFTSKYNVNKIVHVEECGDPLDTIRREKELKGWKRWRKIELINEHNPQWRDLVEG